MDLVIYPPPLFKVLSTVLLIWAFKPLEDSFWQRLFIVVAFLFHPYIQTIYLPLRVDYNFLTTTLFIVYTGIYLRILCRPSRRLGLWLGLCFSLGSWVSLSFFIVGLIPIAYLLLIWICHPKISTPHLSSFFLSALVSCVIFILVENGTLFVYQFDILSLYYCLLLAIAAFAYFVGNYFTTTLSSRLMLFGMIVLSLLGVLFTVEKQLILGPYAAASPFWRQSVFPLIIEHRSPLFGDKIAFLGLMINLIIGLIYFLSSLVSRQLSPPVSGLLWLCLPLGMLSIMMLRWNDYAQPIFILAAAGSIIMIQNAIVRKRQSKPLSNIDLTMAIIALAFAFLPFLIHRLIPHRVGSGRQVCLNEMIQFVASNQFRNLGDKRPLRLIVEPEVAPVVQFYSRNEVLGGFYHPNLDGLKDTFAFTLVPIQLAKDIINKRHLDSMLLCQRTPAPKHSVLEAISKEQPLSFATPFLNHQSKPLFYFYKLNTSSS